MIIMPVKEGENIEKALKKFKRKYERTGVLKELRRRQYFTKPSIAKREAMQHAIYVPPVVGRNAARFGLPSRAAAFRPASRNRDAKHDGVFLRIGMNVAARRRMFPFSLARKPFF